MVAAVDGGGGGFLRLRCLVKAAGAAAVTILVLSA